jgi:hypothetical protein
VPICHIIDKKIQLRSHNMLYLGGTSIVMGSRMMIMHHLKAERTLRMGFEPGTFSHKILKIHKQISTFFIILCLLLLGNKKIMFHSKMQTVANIVKGLISQNAIHNNFLE